MKTATVPQSRIIANVEDSIVGLFAACPELCGFTVKIGGGEIELSDVGLWPRQRTEAMLLICEEIRSRLLELVDELPESRRLISGRTFARAIH